MSDKCWRIEKMATMDLDWKVSAYMNDADDTPREALDWVELTAAVAEGGLNDPRMTGSLVYRLVNIETGMIVPLRMVF